MGYICTVMGTVNLKDIHNGNEKGTQAISKSHNGR